MLCFIFARRVHLGLMHFEGTRLVERSSRSSQQRFLSLLAPSRIARHKILHILYIASRAPSSRVPCEVPIPPQCVSGLCIFIRIWGLGHELSRDRCHMCVIVVVVSRSIAIYKYRTKTQQRCSRKRKQIKPTHDSRRRQIAVSL